MSLSIAFLAAEAMLRVYARTSAAPLARELRADPCQILVEPHGELGYRQRPDRVFRYDNGTWATSNRLSYRGPLVAPAKLPGRIRIVLLGGSTTHGWGVADTATIDRYMRALLAEKHPAEHFDVINLAFDGYDSYQLFERLRSDGMPFQPDYVIINTGINDVRNARFPELQDRDPRTLQWSAEVLRLLEEHARGRPSAWTRLKHHSYLARVPSAVRSLLPSGVDGFTTPYPEAMDYFERNLMRMLNLTRNTETVVLLAIAPSSLPVRYDPTDTSAISYWLGDAATTQAYRDSLDQRLQGLIERSARSGYHVARVPYVHLPPTMFLDDAHLTPAGNQRMAAAFVAVLEPFLSCDTDCIGSPLPPTTGTRLQVEAAARATGERLPDASL